MSGSSARAGVVPGFGKLTRAEMGLCQGLDTAPAILVVPGKQDCLGLGPGLEALLPLHHHQSHS